MSERVVRRWLAVGGVAGVLTTGGIALASSRSGGSGTPHRHPQLSERRILRIADRAAAGAGDRHPTLIQHSEGTRHDANLIASGEGVPGRQWSELIAERGRFVVRDSPGVPGSPVPHGTVLTLIVNASTGRVTDFGVSNNYPELRRLGPVHTDLRRHSRSATRPRGGTTAGAHYGVDIQAVFNRAGNPVLVANFAPNGALARPRFSLCPPATPHRCHRVASHGRLLEPGPEPPGTRFVASASYGGRTYRGSVVWRGRVHPLSRPGLTGRPRMGSVVSPIAARWAGGWGSEFDQLGVEACRHADGSHCRMLGGGELGCPDSSSRPRLGGWFTGWYLFALDARLPKDDICAGTGYSANADLPVWRPGATVARSHALGRISGPPRPRVEILRNAQLRGRALLVASLRCITRCTVELVVTGRTGGRARHLALIGSSEIGIPSRDVRPGPLTVDLHVDDSPSIHGHSDYG